MQITIFIISMARKNEKEKLALDSCRKYHKDTEMGSYIVPLDW